MKIFTIGFTKTTAESFFERLKSSGATKIIDVRLNNISQLSGFAKRDDLRYFAKQISGVDYEHFLALAPTQNLLDSYKKNGQSWEYYQENFLKLMQTRQIENLNKEKISGGCLLCSEDSPHHCHRRLVAEYFSEKWTNVEIIHL